MCYSLLIFTTNSSILNSYKIKIIIIIEAKYINSYFLRNFYTCEYSFETKKVGQSFSSIEKLVSKISPCKI